MSKITYTNKTALYENNDIADINKVKADDMNEIKACVNNNDDMLTGGAVAGDMVVNSIRTKNMFDKNNIINNIRLGASGENVTDTNYFSSYFIQVKPNTTYTLSKEQSSDTLTVYCEYNSSKTFISRSSFITTTTRTFTTSSTTYFLRLSSGKININSLQLEEGSSATAYSDYQALNPSTYFMYTDNDWIVKKYNDGTFEAWYPHSNTRTTTATLNDIFNTYSSTTLTVAYPKILTDVTNVYHYNVNASFTGMYSYNIYWAQAQALAYRIIASAQVSSAMAYRLSAYICGKY